MALTLPEFLAACTGAGQSTPSPSAGGASGTSTSTLRVGWSSEPDVMNPLTSTTSEALEVLQLVYDKLMDYDADLNIVPSLAESTDVSADGTQVTYHLRQGVTWHDGEPFTADDVVFTFSLIAGQKSSQYAQWLGGHDERQGPTGNDVVVTFSKPQAFDPALSIPIVPKHIWDGMSNAEIQTFENDSSRRHRALRLRRVEARADGLGRAATTTSGARRPGPASVHLGAVSERGRHGPEPAGRRDRHPDRGAADDLGRARRRRRADGRVAAGRSRSTTSG